MCDSPGNSLNNICSCVCVNHPKNKKKKRNVPDIQHELNVVKSILQETSSATGDNMFDHLSDLIKQIIDERPQNLIDYFEEYSRNVREKKFRIKNEFLKEVFEETKSYKRAQAVINSFKSLKYGNLNLKNMTEEMLNSSLSLYRPLAINENFLKLQQIWSFCGLGLQNDEAFMLSCALQKLQQHPALKYVRFWGKVFGLQKNYYIAEVSLNQSEIDKRISMMKEEILEKMIPNASQSENSAYINNLIISKKLIPGSNSQYLPEFEISDKFIKASEKPIPKPDIPIIYDIPPEPIGIGLNRFTYFVVNSLTDDWIELPTVTPKQIFQSRHILKYLKGDLENDIVSYPYFHNKEKHLLRTLIARITASTYIAPNGYYKKVGKAKFSDNEEDDDEEEEEEEEEEDEEEDTEINEGKEPQLVINSKYEPIPIENLQDVRMWVHIRSLISNQGRITYFDEAKALKSIKYNSKSNSKQSSVEDEEDEEDEDEETNEENEEDNEKTTPNKIPIPTILLSCAMDKTFENIPPWTIELSNNYNKTNIVVLMKSNLWPGSYCFSYEKISENMYIGWGNKYCTNQFTPEHLPPIQNECPITPNLREITDPSVKSEEEFTVAHLSKSKTFEEVISNDDENEDEDEEDEDDEDTDTDN